MNNKHSFLISIPLFIVNPLITIVLLAIYGITAERYFSPKSKNVLLMLFGVMCCIFISLVNMQIVTKYTVDLELYIYKYKLASQYDYLPYLLIGPDGVVDAYKEPLYHSIVWVMNRLFDGAEKPFKFTISFMEYSLLVSSVILFGKSMKMRMYVIMAGIVWMCFYPYFFTTTMNLVRQTLANSILLYVMIRRFFYNKREWFGMMAMTLIHASSALFLPLLLISKFGKPFRQSWYLFGGIIAILIGYQFLSQTLLGFGTFSEGSSAETVLNRASAGALGEYTFTTLNFLMVLMILILALMIYAGKFLSPIDGLRRLMTAIIILSIFILSNSNQGQIAGRFAHYAVSFMPLLFMIFSESKLRRNTLLFFVSFTMVCLFTIYLHVGLWKFDVVAGGWFTPVLFYLI